MGNFFENLTDAELEAYYRDNSFWKPLIYHGTLYQKFSVSKDGEIRNNNTKHVLKYSVNQRGYAIYVVSIFPIASKKIGIVGHIAVAETFLPNPENKSQVNHKDGNKLNNSVENLEWCTPKENMTHAFALGLFSMKGRSGEKCNLSKLSEKDVKEIRVLLEENQKTMVEIARLYGVSPGSIASIRDGRSWKYLK